MARGAIAYKGQLYLGGSKVEANPTGSATGGNLNKLGVDDTVYAIPQANNGKLTIKQNGTTKGEFTANQSTNSEVNIEVPNVEETDTSDTTPFLYRQTPHNADGVFVDELVGGSVAWNQLVENGNFADTSVWQARNNSTISVNSGVCTVTPGSANSLNIVAVPSPVKYRVGHKILVNANIKSSASIRITMQNNSLRFSKYSSASGSWESVCGIYNSVENEETLCFTNTTNTNAYDIKNVYICDLTQMFGTTIADYVYTLEQTTAGSGIAWLKSHGFFTKPYYPYNDGELISVKTSGKKYVGKNLIDPTTLDLYDVTGTGTMRAGYAPIKLAAGTYSVSWASANTPVLLTNITDGYSYSTLTNGGNFTLNSTSEIMIRTGATSVNNVSISNIQLEKGSATTYEPYTTSTYDISNIDLRGIPKLVNNELVYDGDTYESDGNVTRKYSIVDLGSLEWNYNSTYQLFTLSLSDCITGVQNILPALLISTGKYKLRGATGFGGFNDKEYSLISSTTALGIKDTDYSDATAFKNSLSGVYLVYEKATPTTETADPYTNPQICDKDGTEEFIDDRTVPIPVGHNSRYADLPAIMDGDYLSYMARNFASEEYVDRRMDALGDLAYIDEDGDNSTKFLRGDGTWQNTPAGVTTLDDLTDTAISSPSNGQVLKYDGSKWVNSADYSLPTASAGTLGGIKVGANLSIDANGVLSATGGGANALNDLTDVSAASPSNKQVLAYDSSQSKWVAVDADVVAIPRSYWSSTTRELDFMITVPAYNTQRILKFSLMHAAGLAASEYMFALDRGDVYSSKMAGDTCGISSSYSSSTYTYTITITMPSVSGSPNFIFAMTMYNGSDKTW